MEFGDEIVADAVGLAGWNFHIISRGGQIADDLRAPLWVECSCPKISANEAKAYGLGLFVGDGEECLSRVAIDKFDTENL